MFGLIHCVRYNYPCQLYLGHIGIMVVGLGSVAFHATLLRVGQVLDEVPMLWAALIMHYILFTLNKNGGINMEPNSINFKYFIPLCIYGIISTIVYFLAGFEIFVIMYVLAVFAVFLRTASMVFCKNSSNIDNDKKERKIQFSGMKKYAIMAGIFYIGGFLFLWIPEQIICGNRLVQKNETILKLLNFHAWFHITSSIGPYCWMIFATLTEYYQLKRQTKLKHEPIMKSCSCFTLPTVIPID